MTLRLRLLLSALILSLATTFALGLIVRTAWQQTEESRFDQEFDAATGQLSVDLRRVAPDMAAKLRDICAHDPIVDSALIGVSSGSLDSRLLSLRARVPDLKKALGFDELILVSGDEQVLAGDFKYQPETWASLASKRKEGPGLRLNTPSSFEAACIKREGPHSVALIGAIALAPLLEQSGARHGLRLSLKESGQMGNEETYEGTHQRIMVLDSLGGAKVTAERSENSLGEALSSLDAQVASGVGATLFGALFLAFLLSRGLAGPVVTFAERTRQAVKGKVESLPIAGGPELEQAARAFNETLEDLRDLRTQLALTERIAARREVARQIAHEIKNPLSPIRTSIETLRKLKERGHPQFDELFDETTGTVLREVRRISDMVSHFSEYARLPSPVSAPFDLAELINELCQIHQGLGASLTTQVEELPTILADRDQISQVLTNLIKNAIEATDGSERSRVHLEAHCRSENRDWIQISVSDNGPGVSESHRAKLFEPYQTTKKEGTGLGLPISHRIAIEHGGDLTYTTSSSGGACFILLLRASGPPTLSDND